MKYSLRSKLSFSSAAMSLLLVALISFCVNVLLQSQFKNYVIRQQELRNGELLNLVANQYGVSGGGWNEDVFENIGVSALEQGMIMKIRDESGNTVWDAMVHNNGLCVQCRSLAKNMQSHSPDSRADMNKKAIP
jgi:hypothetical protein